MSRAPCGQQGGWMQPPCALGCCQRQGSTGGTWSHMPLASPPPAPRGAGGPWGSAGSQRCPAPPRSRSPPGLVASMPPLHSLWWILVLQCTERETKIILIVFSFRLRSGLPLSPSGSLCLGVNLCKSRLLACTKLCKQTAHVLADRRDEGLLNLFLCFRTEIDFS